MLINQMISRMITMQNDLFEKRLILQGLEFRLELGAHERDRHQGYFDTAYILDEKRKLEGEISKLSSDLKDLLMKIENGAYDSGHSGGAWFGEPANL